MLSSVARLRAILPILALLFATAAFADDPPKPTPKTDDPLTWLTSLADGKGRAQKHKQPILVRVSSESCPWCAKLEKELNQPKVKEELERWTLVSLDVDRLGRDNRTLLVGAVPALRLLSSTGRVMASRDGFVEAGALVTWLKDNHDKAAVMPTEELTSDKPPSADGVGKLVAELKNRDPSVREAAVRRLLPHPALAAAAVADAFAHGTLQTRLAALELLREWKAPVQDLDPWQTETLKPECLKALRKWAGERKPAPDDSRGALTPEQREAVRRDLARLVEAPDTEAAAIRERLARHGPALLPEVYAQLKDATTDQARERLTALRYRLAASTALALALPGGIDRLASSIPAQRHQAVQELLARVTAAEEPLLLELFTNPDPLVRELSLHGLRKVAGSRARTALTRLLADPEPNVRAAVLKQLAEKPAPALVPQVRDYLAKEKDPDLIVHAVRVFRGSTQDAAVRCLTELLTHESWRVRAEVAEALGECLSHDNVLEDMLSNEVRIALIGRLKDSDGFVVSRVVKAMRKLKSATVIGPLVEAAETHAELAPEIIKGLCSNDELRAKALPYIRKLCSHRSPAARAVALQQLCYASQEVRLELQVGLMDPHSEVRIAAATALLRLVPSSNPDDKDEVGIDPDESPGKRRTEKSLTDWLPGMGELVHPLLTAKAAAERVAGALVLVALGKQATALPVLLDAAKAEPNVRGEAAAALRWLPWEKRLDLYRQLLAVKPGADDLGTIASEMTQVRDKRAIPLMWELAAREDLTAEGAAALVQALRDLYYGHTFYAFMKNHRDIKEAERKQAVAVARPRAASGPELQRLIALVLLESLAPEEAIKAAAALVADPKAAPQLREDAFKVLVLTRPRSEALRTAVEGLSHATAGVRWLSLLYLSGEVDYWFGRVLEHTELDVADHGLLDRDGRPRPGRPWVPTVPKEVTAEAVRPLLADPDPRNAAQAGYLLALLGDSAGLPPLLRYWRERAPDNELWVLTVTRAIAALGDDRRVSILEEIYALYEAEVLRDVTEFYWTMRRLEGPNAQKLRKRMQVEMGVDPAGDAP